MANTDPIARIAKQRIISLSAELEVQLGDRKGGAVAIEMLRRLHDRATESLKLLAFVDLHTPKGRVEAVTLQNEVKRYDEWVAWMTEIVQEGQAYDKEFSQEDRDELLDFLVQTPEGQQEAAQLGLVVPAQDA